MSELKEFDVIINDDYKTKCYMKADADKVIAELERKVDLNKRARQYWRKEWTLEYKDNCHQKYKRCMAMASRCYWKWQYWKDSAPGYERQFQWENRAYKWHKRWLKLAEKFKEG